MTAPIPTPVKVPARRLDIQGLRGLAIAQILVFHLWGIGTPVGVDAFVLISAFLMGASMRQTWRRGETFALVPRWIHLFKRLLPALVVTIVLTSVACLFMLPPTRWAGMRTQAGASLAFMQNFYLSRAAVDYYADAGATSSPFMHLWYVAMQGQVYLVLPALFALVQLVAPKRWEMRRRVAVVVLGVLVLASLAWTVVAISRHGAAGVYFDPLVRAWEFALGALVGLTLSDRVAKARPLVPLSVVGFVFLAVVGFVTLRAYPGWLSLPVVVATCAILAAGVGAHHPAWRPLAWLGDRSYALYLAHWPLISLAKAWRGVDQVSLRFGAVLLVVSLLGALVLHVLVDQPLSRWPRRRGAWKREAVVVVASLALGGVPIVAAHAYLIHRGHVSQEGIADTNAYPGAEALRAGWKAPVEYPPALPLPENLDHEWGALPQPCEGPFGGFSPEVARDPKSTCTQLPENPKATLRAVVVGDSHAEQYSEMIKVAAEEHGWNLALHIYGGCQYTVGKAIQDWQACADHNDAITRWLVDEVKPDVVFVVATRGGVGGPDYFFGGLDEAVTELTAAGIRVVGLRDNPQYADSMYECALGEGIDRGHLVGCPRPAADVYAPTMPDEPLRANPLYRSIDMEPHICPDGMCYAIIGNTFVWRDHDHLTLSFSRSLGRLLHEEIAAAATR